ncbi:MAG TPA: nucleotide exchange factor GrpE [Planctomycetes bacterium]|nr:nucleotide exchange factor GrpE [Planctomycetota bacterium]
MKQKKSETPSEQKKPLPKKNELQELRQQIEELQQEKDELFAKLQRVSADYDNLQKRTSKQIADTIGYEKEKIIKTLLPALDNFEHTLQNVHSAENFNVLLKGIQIIYDQMLDILKLHNVELIKALGEPFEPALHEAMMQKTDPEQQENIVLEEFQKGYKLNGRVIRPSKVIVNKLTPKQPAKQKPESPEQTTGTE